MPDGFGRQVSLGIARGIGRRPAVGVRWLSVPAVISGSRCVDIGAAVREHPRARAGIAGIDGRVRVARLEGRPGVGCLRRSGILGRCRRGAPGPPVPAHPDADPGRDHDRRHDRRVQRVPRNVVVDRGDVLAREIPCAHPRPDPQCGAKRVEGQELEPFHLRDAGDEPVRLPESLDEPRHHDDLAAVPVEEALRFFEPLGGEEDVLAPAFRQCAPAEPPDRVPDIVTGHGGAEANQADRDHVEPSGPGEDGGRDEYRLARHRDPEVLDQHKEENRPQPVVPKRRREGVEEARQDRQRSAGQPHAAQHRGGGGKHLPDHPPSLSRRHRLGNRLPTA